MSAVANAVARIGNENDRGITVYVSATATCGVTGASVGGDNRWLLLFDRIIDKPSKKAPKGKYKQCSGEAASFGEVPSG